MQSTTLSFENMHNHGELFASLLQARKQSLIARERWNLPDAAGMEYDQYDTPASRWVAVHQQGRVMGGVRLTPTTARCGIYSYMIRDAQNGLLETIPTDLLDFPAPVAQDIWEVTRGFVASDVPDDRKQDVRQRIGAEVARVAEELHIRELLALLPASWNRWMAGHQLDPSPVGRTLHLDGVDYQALSLRLPQPVH